MPPPQSATEDGHLQVRIPSEFTTKIHATAYEVRQCPFGLELAFAYEVGLPGVRTAISTVTLLAVSLTSNMLTNREGMERIARQYNRGGGRVCGNLYARMEGREGVHCWGVIANAIGMAASGYGGTLTFSLIDSVDLVTAKPGRTLDAQGLLHVVMPAECFAEFYLEFLPAADTLLERTVDEFPYVSDQIESVSNRPKMGEA